MNDRERLEKIKKLRIKYYSTWTKDASSKIALDLMRNHSKWLIAQAERAQELEKGYKEYVSFTESNNYNMDVEFEKLYKQNKRYREILKKIISVKNDKEFNPYAYMMLEIIEWAEEALEGESK